MLARCSVFSDYISKYTANDKFTVILKGGGVRHYRREQLHMNDSTTLLKNHFPQIAAAVFQDVELLNINIWS